MKVLDVTISSSLVKGFVHAFIIPFIIAFVTYQIESRLTIIASIAYILFVMAIYKKLQTIHEDNINHPIHESADWFLRFTGVWLALFAFIAYAVLMGALQ